MLVIVAKIVLALLGWFVAVGTGWHFVGRDAYTANERVEEWAWIGGSLVLIGLAVGL